MGYCSNSIFNILHCNLRYILAKYCNKIFQGGGQAISDDDLKVAVFFFFFLKKEGIKDHIDLTVFFFFDIQSVTMFGPGGFLSVFEFFSQSGRRATA